MAWPVVTVSMASVTERSGKRWVTIEAVSTLPVSIRRRAVS
jgi:hypothetical protein